MIISLDAIALSIDALTEPNPVRFELNWRIWRLMQLRRVRERMREVASEFIGYSGDWNEMHYLCNKEDAIELIYSDRYNSKRRKA